MVQSAKSILEAIQVKTASCSRHGEYESSGMRAGGKVKWSPCPDCHREEERQEQAKRARQLSARGNQVRLEQALADAAIPRRYTTRTLDTYQATTEGQQKALSSARRFADNFEAAMEDGANLIMAGSPGTGKTHLAIGIAHQVIANGYTAAFMTSMNAIRRVRETYRRDSDDTERAAIASLAAPDLLILDEVGVQLGTDAERITLFEIINARYEQMRPMILISNLDIEGVQEFLGRRSVDRLREGGGRAVVFDWASYRASAA